MIAPSELAEGLRAHYSLCQEVLKAVEREGQLLRSSPSEQPKNALEAKKNLLAQLSESLDKIRQRRIAWLKLEPAQRQGHPEIAELLRENQNLVMKILVLDRENEQTLLRQGLVPPRHVPAANRQRPHFVASMYQRNAAL